MKNIVNNNKHIIIITIISLIFYVGIGIYDGPEYCVDTDSYVSMSIYREAVYSVFLAVLRVIFGIEKQLYGMPAYLTLVVFMQSILWAFSVSYLAKFVEKYGIIYSYIAMVLQLGVAFLNRFVAKRGSMYSESLMTEGIAMPVVVIFCVELCKWFYYGHKKDLISASLLAIFLINVRKQMMIAVLMLLCMAFIYYVIKKRTRNIKSFFMIILVSAIIIVSAKLVDYTYIYIKRGVWTGHAGNSQAKLCTLLYSSDISYAEYFDDEDIKNIFIDIITKCDDQGLLAQNVSDNATWLDYTLQYAYSYDIIGYDIAFPCIEEYVAEKYNLDYPDYIAYTEKIQEQIVDVLIKHPNQNLLKTVLYNFIMALGYSNGRATSNRMILVSLVFYLFFIFEYVYIVRKQINEEIACLAEVTMAGIMINSVVVGLLIFAQPRYMVYFMGLFYFVIVLMTGYIFRYLKIHKAD